MLELLSPAGSPESVIAAVQNGADAIYMGFGGFNARQGAKNFTDEQFDEALKYCRVRGCKVFLTLNTLTGDRELNEATKLAVRAAEQGVSAILVQDLGLLRHLKRILPDMHFHASTQMSVHNLAGVQAAAELGLSRVVLARELSLRDIEYIASRSPIETEVFVHGALCFAHSGQCYLSGLIGRRSGNRGACAQPCRMDYSLGGRMDSYPMSLKDNCLVNHLSELERAGVTCVKIEGRMKRPEYTAVATRIYSAAIREKRLPTTRELEELEMAFSRQGFTDGYFTGKKGPEMFGVREEADREINKFFAEVRRGYANGELRRVGVQFYAVVEPNRPARLAAMDVDGNKAAYSGAIPQTAQNQPTTAESLREQLYKTGGTPYLCESVQCSVAPGLFLSASAVNEMRRAVLAQLTEQRSTLPQVRLGTPETNPLPSTRREQPLLNIQVSSPDQLTPELAAVGCNRLYLPLQLISEHFDRVEPFIRAGATPVAVFPRVVTDSERSELLALLDRAKLFGIHEALVGNLGHIAAARQHGFDVRGDFGLNTFNSLSLRTLSEAGLLSATASFELRLAQVRDMLKCMDTELIVYGRLPAMVTDQCLIKNSVGHCACHTTAHMNDRKGSSFPVMREFGCRNVIFNSHKLFLADKKEDYESLGLWGIRLLFTTESSRECVEVARTYIGERDYHPNGITRGLYYRGVE